MSQSARTTGAVSAERTERAGFRLRSVFCALTTAALLSLFATSSAHAFSYSSILPPPGAELTQVQIMDLIYGGTFVQSGVDYSNGSIDLVRVWDADATAGPLDLILGDPSLDIDQIWTDGIATVTAQAKYAALGQSFGWNGGGTLGAGYIELLTDADIGGASVEINVMGDMLWGVSPSSGDTFWSKDSENSDAFDHLITYQVLGLGGSPTVWLQFWEDLPSSGSDFDYNDFVIEVQAVPEPGTGLLLAVGVSILTGTRRRRS
ncbi:MAG: DUF4114 domain-containing protein [Deltaproteobacteria bacterium]|nr:DUF4114 domain-containing protein [Deltaproteobacteria bacterium]